MLAKDPDDRYQNIIELPVDLKNVDLTSTGTSQISTESLMMQAVRKPKFWQRVDVLYSAIVVAIVLTFLAVWYLKPEPEPIPRVTYQNQFDLPPEPPPDFPNNRIAISRDGRNIAYVAVDGESRKIFIRPVNKLESIPRSGTEGAINPFFSHDGQSIGFFTDDKELKRIDIDGSKLMKIADVASIHPRDATCSPRGATWGEDGTIIFGILSSGLWQVPASGGDPKQITSPDTSKGIKAHYWPQLLPGGRHVLFTVCPVESNLEKTRTCILSLDSEPVAWDTLLYMESYNARYVPSSGTSTGHIIFMRQGGLMARPFDLKKLEITGDQEPLPEKIYTQNNYTSGVAYYSISDNGTLVYIPPREKVELSQSLVWVDRQGNEELITDEIDIHLGTGLSPDGKLIAVTIVKQDTNILKYDIERKVFSDFTFEGTNESHTFSPDGEMLAFHSRRDSLDGIFIKPFDGSRKAELLWGSEYETYPVSWSPNWELAFYEVHPETNGDIWIFNANDNTAAEFYVTEYDEKSPMFSPDGKWIAYVTDESGQKEIWVQPYPPTGEKHKIPSGTSGGSVGPFWHPNEKELFYQSGLNMMSLPIEYNSSFSFGSPTPMFAGNYRWNPGITFYDYDAQNNRFLMVKLPVMESRDKIIEKTNWFEELKEKFKDENK